MTAQTFNEALESHFRRSVEKKINELGRSVAAGAMPSFEQYKYQCGVIKGLQDSLVLIGTSLKELMQASRGTDA